MPDSTREDFDLAVMARVFAGSTCLLGLVLAVTSVINYPNERTQRELARQLQTSGATVVADRVEQRLDHGRDWYVAGVRVKFVVRGEAVVAELQNATDDSDAMGDYIDEEKGSPHPGTPLKGWRSVPPVSRYAPPLTVSYLSAHPETAMATKDLPSVMAAGSSTPRDVVLFLVPMAVVLVTPSWRRWVLRGSRWRP